jgi:hypothetical protein
MTRQLKAAIKDFDVLTENELKGQIGFLEKNIEWALSERIRLLKVIKEHKQLILAAGTRLKKTRRKNKKKGK